MLRCLLTYFRTLRGLLASALPRLCCTSHAFLLSATMTAPFPLRFMRALWHASGREWEREGACQRPKIQVKDCSGMADQLGGAMDEIENSRTDCDRMPGWPGAAGRQMMTSGDGAVPWGG